MRKIKKTVEVYGRQVTLPTGLTRIDSKRHVGWQADAEGNWKYFSADQTRDLVGSLSSLALVCAKLKRRLKETPPDTSIRRKVHPKKDKDSGLPIGITQVERKRKTRRQDEWYFVVHVPVFGRKARNRKVYVGARATVTKRMETEALEKAVDMRDVAVKAYLRAERTCKQAIRISV